MDKNCSLRDDSDLCNNFDAKRFSHSGSANRELTIHLYVIIRRPTSLCQWLVDISADENSFQPIGVGCRFILSLLKLISEFVTMLNFGDDSFFVPVRIAECAAGNWNGGPNKLPVMYKRPAPFSSGEVDFTNSSEKVTDNVDYEYANTRLPVAKNGCSQINRIRQQNAWMGERVSITNFSESSIPLARATLPKRGMLYFHESPLQCVSFLVARWAENFTCNWREQKINLPFLLVRRKRWGRYSGLFDAFL